MPTIKYGFQASIDGINEDISNLYRPNYFDIPLPGEEFAQPPTAQFQNKTVYCQSFTGTATGASGTSPTAINGFVVVGTMTPTTKIQLAKGIDQIVAFGGQVQTTQINNTASNTYMPLGQSFSVTTAQGGNFNYQISTFLTVENNVLFLNLFRNTPNQGNFSLTYNIWVKYTKV